MSPPASKQAAKFDAKAGGLAEAFETEHRALESLRAARSAGDVKRIVQGVEALRAARAVKRRFALEAKSIHTVEDHADLAAAIESPCAGLWLVSPPLVGADGRNLRDSADHARVAALVVVREPVTRTGLWPVVMIGPVTVRAKVQPPRKVNAEWFAAALEALGDEAIADVSAELGPGVRLDRLLDRLQTVPESDRLHEAALEACAAALAAGERPGRRGPETPETPVDTETDADAA